MPFLTKDNLTTHIYPEILDEITRGDDTKATTAISNAITEVKAYLGKYDLLKLFGSETAEPTVTDEWLKDLVKDVACWRLIKLANPNIDVAMLRTGYEDTIKTLDKIQKGLIDPEGWPYKPINPQTNFPEGSSVAYSSNTKRRNHF